MLGAVWESLGYPEDALKYYEEALSRRPSYLPALRRSVNLDLTLNNTGYRVEERIRMGLQLETDEQWRSIFDRALVRLHERK